MRRVIIIQARMTSTRLPGKVLMDVAGRPMLTQQIRRLKECKAVEEIVIATTTNPADAPLVELAQQAGVGWFRGSERDVLSRYVGAARQFHADVVVRVTADCPLIDPEVTDRVINELVTRAAECDYASNVGLTSKWVETATGQETTPLERTFPRGLDVETLFWDTLVRVDRMAQSAMAREHVTVVVRSEHPELFLSRTVFDSQNNSDLRWTVDTGADLQLIRRLYHELDLGERIAPYAEILAYVRARPQLARLNVVAETVTG